MFPCDWESNMEPFSREHGVLPVRLLAFTPLEDLLCNMVMIFFVSSILIIFSFEISTPKQSARASKRRAMSGSSDIMPIVSKIYCSPSLATLTVRKRPRVVNGGGFVVTDCTPKTVFAVDGCGTIGSNGELIVRDEDGYPILRIQKKGGVIQVLSTRNRWKGYAADDDEGPNKLVFSLRETRTCLGKNEAVRICIEPKACNKDYDFEVHGSFLDKACTIDDRRGAVVAQVIVREVMMGSKEFYQVVVQPGYDQAFVVGVIAVLDNIHGESTRC